LSEPEEPGSADSPPGAAQTDSVAEQTAAPHQPRTAGTEPLPSAVTSAVRQGPIGKQRSVLFVILISIITLGIYHLYWVYKVYDEMKQHTGKGVGGVLGLVIAIVINPVNWFVMPSEVGRMYRDDGRGAPVTGWAGLWMILPLVGWFVWTAKVQGALNRYWESEISPT
jgi:hypothetical protein